MITVFEQQILTCYVANYIGLCISNTEIMCGHRMQRAIGTRGHETLSECAYACITGLAAVKATPEKA